MQFWPRQPGNALPGRAATGSGRIFHLAIQPGRQMMTRLPVEYNCIYYLLFNRVDES